MDGICACGVPGETGVKTKPLSLVETSQREMRHKSGALTH